jgi:membrane protein implicated in regulation of membrane protease activity
MMENIVSFLGEIQPWYWWALAAVLIGIEIMSPTFFFLWPGIAAAIVGVIAFIIPSLGADIQILMFAVLAVLCTVFWKKYTPASWSSTEPHPTLNRRAEQNIGRHVKAAVNFSGGRGAIHLDDTRWSAVSTDGSDPVEGDALVIVGADGVVLKVGREAA